MHLVYLFYILLSVCVTTVFSSDSTETKVDTEDKGYRIEKPGTITFTVGVKIKGKVEKPQVVIFLPKEESLYREMSFSYSFKEDISKPLPFVPILEEQ